MFHHLIIYLILKKLSSCKHRNKTSLSLPTSVTCDCIMNQRNIIDVTTDSQSAHLRPTFETRFFLQKNVPTLRPDYYRDNQSKLKSCK